MQRLLFLILLFFLIFLSARPQPGYTAEKILEVTSTESEDRNFIRNLFEDKRYDFAREEAKGYLSEYPKGAFRAEINFVLGQLEVIQKHHQIALSYFKTVIDRYPDSPYVEDAMFQSGVLLIKMGKEDVGRTRLKELLRKNSDSRFKSKIYFELGQSAFKQKYWKTAEDRLTEALKTEDLSEILKLEATNSLTWAVHFQGKRQEAKILFEELLRSKLDEDRKAKITYQLGVNWYQDKQYHISIEWYERLIKDWPRSEFVAKAQYGIAESIYMLHQSGKQKASKEEKERAIRLYTENLSNPAPIEPELSRYHRAWLYISLQMPDLAEQDFEYLQDHSIAYRQDVELTLTRADYLEGKNDWSHAHRILLVTTDALKNKNIPVELRLRIIKNEFHRKDCQKADDWTRYKKNSELKEHQSQINYYIGKCYFSGNNLELAKQTFEKIPLNSIYSPLFFKDYLTTFQKTKDLQGGIDLLTQAAQFPEVGKKEDILLLKAELYLEFEQWVEIFQPMEEIQQINPTKSNDSWYLIILAKTHENLSLKKVNSKYKGKHQAVKSAKYHEDQSLRFYQAAYNNLPQSDIENRLSIIETLVKKYKSRAEFEEVVVLYQDAIKLIKNPERIATLKLQIGKLYFNRLKQLNEAKLWFKKLHGQENDARNYEASTLLAEIQIGQKDYPAAIETLNIVAKQPIESTNWFPIIHFRLGELFQSQENWEKALMEYRMVLNTKHKSKFRNQAKKRIKSIVSYLKEVKLAEIKKQKGANK